MKDRQMKVIKQMKAIKALTFGEILFDIVHGSAHHWKGQKPEPFKY